jgi:hypothetical protein
MYEKPDDRRLESKELMSELTCELQVLYPKWKTIMQLLRKTHDHLTDPNRCQRSAYSHCKVASKREDAQLYPFDDIKCQYKAYVKGQNMVPQMRMCDWIPLWRIIILVSHCYHDLIKGLFKDSDAFNKLVEQGMRNDIFDILFNIVAT